MVGPSQISFLAYRKMLSSLSGTRRIQCHSGLVSLTGEHSLDTESVVPLEVSYVLRLAQRKLTNFVLHHADPAPTIDYLPDGEELRNVTSMSFYLGSKHDAERAAKVLQQASAVHSVSLHLNTTFPGIAKSDASLSSIETIFSAWSQNGQKIGLRSVGFNGFFFSKCGPLLATVLSPAHLRAVVLVQCWDTNSLLESLSQAGLRLTTFVDELATHDEDEGGMVEAFLQSFRGLETLRLTTTNSEEAVFADCSWAAIRNHATTLNSLTLDDFADETMPFVADDYDRSMPEFSTAMGTCQALKQLAIRAPSPDRYPQRFSDFLVGRLLARQIRRITDWKQDALKQLVNLRTLRLFVYPDALDCTHDAVHEAECSARGGAQLQQCAKLHFGSRKQGLRRTARELSEAGRSRR